MGNYLTRHTQVLLATLGDMVRAPAATINTVLIIAITLLLPSLLYVLIKSAEGLSDSWQGRPQISIFLQKDANETQAQLIFQEIQLHPDIELAEFVTPKQALEEFRLLSETASLEEELDFLGGNPLPPSIVLMPNKQSMQADTLLTLKEQLSKIDGIDTIRLDLDWTQRFSAILSMVSRVGLLLSILLGLGLVLIVGNTIKLLIHNRRDEIEITKLVGGTNIFVRRPFLYYGTLLGLLGALVSLIFLLLAAGLIREPMAKLASLYQHQSLVYQLQAVEITAIVIIGSVLGWMAARWSVAQHLWRIKPR